MLGARGDAGPDTLVCAPPAWAMLRRFRAAHRVQLWPSTQPHPPSAEQMNTCSLSSSVTQAEGASQIRQMTWGGA